MKNYIKTLPFILLGAPLLLHAQFSGTRDLIRAIGDIVQTLTLIVAAIALLVFFWGLAKFILKIGNEDAVDDGKRLMIWGLVALFVMVSVWGIIGFFQRELGLPGTAGGILPSRTIPVPLNTAPSVTNPGSSNQPFTPQPLPGTQI